MKLLFACLLVAGCGSTPPSSATPCSPFSCSNLHDALACDGQCAADQSFSVDVTSCSNGASFDEQLDTLQIAADFSASLRTLEDASTKAALLGDSATTALLQLAQHPDVDARPATFSFAQGVYSAPLVSAGNGAFQAHFTFGKDYAVAGNIGDTIVPSLFVADSYLIGAQVTLDGGVATISYASTGVLVELFGLGTTPVNPFEMGVFDPNDLGLQNLAATMSDDETSALGTHVSFTGSFTRSASLGFTGTEVPIDFHAGATRNAQTLVVAASSLRHTEVGQGVDGSLTFAVSGGTFAFRGTVVLATSTNKRTLAISCK